MLKGKGYFIWQIEKCAPDADTLVARAKAAKLGHLLIKIADGDEIFPNKRDDPNGAKEKLTRESIEKLRKEGIVVWGWSFIYGTTPDPTKQAQRLVQRMADFDLDGAVINAEKLANNPWSSDNARRFMDTLINALPRTGITDPTLALSSYRYPGFHTDFPFDDFMLFCQVAMPQVYWVNRSGGDPLKELQGSFDEYTARYPTKEFIPTGAAYGEQQGTPPNDFYWEARPDQVTMFLNQADAQDFPAVNFWSWQHAWSNRAMWDAIASHPFGAPIQQISTTIRATTTLPAVTSAPDGATLTPPAPSGPNIAIPAVGLPDTADDDGVAIIDVGAPGYQEGIYADSGGQLNAFVRDDRTFTWSQGEVQRSTTYAQWLPRITKTGEYLIEAYIPGINASARRARYHITGVIGQASTTVVELNQLNISDDWARLGFFQLDGGHQFSGMVALNNLVGSEANPDTKIAYGPIRWRRVERTGVKPGYADGFDSPVGTETERREPNTQWGPRRTDWNGDWVDANPFLNHYFLGYHTGVDLNRPADKDKGAPAFAIADGTVTYAGTAFNRDGSPSGFGTLVVIKHDPYIEDTGQETTAFSRYGHMKDIVVKKGDRVRRGDQVGTVWNNGTQAHHLHFDISTTGVLGDNVGHWPGERKTEVVKHYSDPYDFIRSRRPRE